MQYTALPTLPTLPKKMQVQVAERRDALRLPDASGRDGGMRMHALRVRNFRGIVDRKISFDGADGEARPLTVIVGPNRSGKTTMLDALHLVTACVENPKHPKLRVGFDPDDPLLRPNPNQGIEVDLEFSLSKEEWRELVAVEQRLDGYPTPEFAERYTLSFQWPFPQGGWAGCTEQSVDLAAQALRGRAKAKVALARRLVSAQIIEKLGGVFYLDQHRSVEMTSQIVRTGTNAELTEAAGGRDILPWMELQARLDMRWDTERQGESGWAHLRRIYAELARPSIIDDIEPFSDGFDLRMKDAETGRTYYSMGTSSGERLMLRLAANLVAWGAFRSVVLIDEIELHLHPQWQRNLLHFCRRGGGGDNQFIVTTHSEALLRYVDPESVIVLEPMEVGG